MGDETPSRSPWPKASEASEKDTGFSVAKKRYSRWAGHLGRSKATVGRFLFWDRSHQWSVPTNATLTGPEHDTDYEWHQGRMRYSSGWAHDPSWSQSKRVKPTHVDPEDDRRSDPALPSGSTSKPWGPVRDQSFWSEDSSANGPAASASSATSPHWRPKFRADKGIASNAGDTSEGSTTGPRLGCVDELSILDEEAPRQAKSEWPKP